MPTTLKGGTKATAIATPGNALEILRRVLAKAPAAPAAIAMPKSIRVGLTRDIISVSTVSKPIIEATTQETKIVSKMPLRTVKLERRSSLRLPIAVE